MTQSEELRSRRAVLVTAVGAAATAAATTLSRPIATTAASGDPLVLGKVNDSGDMTELNGRFVVNSSEQWESLGAWALGGVATYGTSETGTGVLGESHGSNGRGSAGVRGWTDNPSGIAVVAENDFGGVGLQVTGKAQFLTRSGRATIAAGSSFVDIDLRPKGGLAGTPLCFATLRSFRAGVYVAAVRANYPSSGKARIYLNKAVSSTTNVSWLVLN